MSDELDLDDHIIVGIHQERGDCSVDADCQDNCVGGTVKANSCGVAQNVDTICSYSTF